MILNCEQTVSLSMLIKVQTPQEITTKKKLNSSCVTDSSVYIGNSLVKLGFIFLVYNHYGWQAMV